MRLFKLGLISLLLLSFFIFLFSLIFPSQVRISRAITIPRSAGVIRQQLSDLRKWQEWNVMLSNPSLTHVHVAESIFKSDQLNVRMTSSDSVRTVWMQKNGNVIFSGINVIPSSSDTTIVQWYFDFHLKWYPWEKFGSIVFDRQLGPVMEKSLEKLGDLFTNSP